MVRLAISRRLLRCPSSLSAPIMWRGASLLENCAERSARRSFEFSVMPHRPLYSAHRFFASSAGGGGASEEDGQLVISILGPANAGKSTLFNRFMCKEANKTYRLAADKSPRRRRGRASGHVGHKNPSKRYDGAIVTPVPGTTRDRRECVGRIGGTTFRLIDTAGVDGERIEQLVGKAKDPLQREMMLQTQEAAKAADLVLLLFDARVGVTSDLAETARWLRRVRPDDDSGITKRRVLILANKLEGDHWTTDPTSPVLDHLAEASRVGFGVPVPVSAERGEGLAEVAAIIERLSREKREELGIPEKVEEEGASSSGKDGGREKPLQLAVLGRQNVGKSTLVNALLRQNRVIAGAMPGLTRDAIAVEWSWNGRPVKIVDTAGIRKAGKRERSDDIEDLAVQDAMRAMKVADVAVLVLDAEARVLQRQELAIADAVVREGRSLVVAANKMDLLVEADYTKDEYADAVQEQIQVRFPMLRKTPVVAMSSLTGECVEDLMPVVFDARDRWANVISTGVLNSWLAEVIDGQAPPYVNGRPAKIKYIMQTKGRPPTFLLFCNVSQLPATYLRYLTRNFQETFKMYGMEVRLAIKKGSENPYAEKVKRGSRGVGGKEARKKRLWTALKTTGKRPEKGRRRRFQRH